MKNYFLKIISIAIIFNILLFNLNYTYGEDLSNKSNIEYNIKNIYYGTSDSVNLIKNLKFDDLENNENAKDIYKIGSFNIIKGYKKSFLPNKFITNEEAIIFTIRLMGLEKELQITEKNKNLDNIEILGKAYIDLAFNKKLINKNMYDNLLSKDENNSLSRYANATKEQIAVWITQGLILAGSKDVNLTKEQQKIYNFKDWDKIEPSYIPYVEFVTSNNIIKDSTENNFNPKNFVTRKEMAVILSNIDSIYYNLKNIEKKHATVIDIKDSQEKTTQKGAVWRKFYVRDSKGSVDILTYEFLKTSSPQDGILDAPTFKNNKLCSLIDISKGDQLEYFISLENNTILYVNVLSKLIKKDTVEGILYNIDYELGKIIIKDNNKDYIYKMIDDIYGIKNNEEFIILDKKSISKEDLALGNKVRLNLSNDMVEEISFIGTEDKEEEIKGIVIENNFDFGYIVFINDKGNKITKNYYPKDMKVQKQEYYQKNDDIGYISQMFPNFKYNPRESNISSIEPGDIIFIKCDKKNKDLITNISASTNYKLKFGCIKQINKNKNNLLELFIEYENGQNTLFQIPKDIFISKLGKQLKEKDIKVGDFVKLLVNQAIVNEGYILESIKEIIIEDDSRHISDIIKGQISGVNEIQNEIIIQNPQKLTKTGWDDYSQLKRFNISSNIAEYYKEDKRISLDYANKFLKREDGEVYLAIDKSVTGQKVRKVTFREGRDELLKGDKVSKVDGLGNFFIFSNKDNIKTDNGTIVRKNGRLVDGINIKNEDYALVSLNGDKKAAVVDIFENGSYRSIPIGRGRILNVKDGKSFTVTSMAILSDNDWEYTPIEREFTIDYNTLFLNKNGYVDPKTFLDYTKTSVKDKTYNIIYNGTKATHVIDIPYSNKYVKGTIYKISEKSISIKDAKYYNKESGKWLDISRTNNILDIEFFPNTITIKSNNIVQINDLLCGDELKIITDNLKENMQPGSKINGNIILVEK